MTRQELREHYAGLAMQGMIASQGEYLTVHEIVKASVNCADALVTALKCLHEKSQTVHGIKTCTHCREILD